MLVYYWYRIGCYLNILTLWCLVENFGGNNKGMSVCVDRSRAELRMSDGKV